MQVTASDGVDLAVNETGPSDAATIVCVHGYPDNSSAWAGVVAELSRRYHVVTYDVRGAGRSGKPTERQAYRLDQLAADLRAVVDAVSPDRAVHLLAHDWGSIQSWHAVTGEQLADRVASYTSVSGPSLDHTAYWMRSALRPGGARLRDVARQLAESAYIVLFTVPVLPEWLWRKGVLDRGLAAASMIGRDPAASSRPHGRCLTRSTACSCIGRTCRTVCGARSLGRPTCRFKCSRRPATCSSPPPCRPARPRHGRPTCGCARSPAGTG